MQHFSPELTEWRPGRGCVVGLYLAREAQHLQPRQVSDAVRQQVVQWGGRSRFVIAAWLIQQWWIRVRQAVVRRGHGKVPMWVCAPQSQEWTRLCWGERPVAHLMDAGALMGLVGRAEWMNRAMQDAGRMPWVTDVSNAPPGAYDWEFMAEAPQEDDGLPEVEVELPSAVEESLVPSAEAVRRAVQPDVVKTGETVEGAVGVVWEQLWRRRYP